MNAPSLKRREFLAGLAAGAATLSLSSLTQAESASASSSSLESTPGIADLTFRPLAPGEVVPSGWLKRQLRIQADGLTGHLDEFWPDVAQSQWFGGKAEGWERAPYWMDGAIALAWALDDNKITNPDSCPLK